MNICEDVDADGDHYVNDGDPQEGVRRLVPLCGRFTRRCKACSSPCKTSGPCQQYPSSILSIGCRQVSKLISYTWFAMQGMFISSCKTSGPCRQHLRLSIIFCAFWLQILILGSQIQFFILGLQCKACPTPRNQQVCQHSTSANIDREQI